MKPDQGSTTFLAFPIIPVKEKNNRHGQSLSVRNCPTHAIASRHSGCAGPLYKRDMSVLPSELCTKSLTAVAYQVVTKARRQIQFFCTVSFGDKKYKKQFQSSASRSSSSNSDGGATASCQRNASCHGAFTMQRSTCGKIRNNNDNDRYM